MGAETGRVAGRNVGAAMAVKDGLNEGAPTLRLTAETEVTAPPGRPMDGDPAPGVATFPDSTMA